MYFRKIMDRVRNLRYRYKKNQLFKKLGLRQKTDYRMDLLETMDKIKSNCSRGQVDILIDVGSNKGEFASIFSELFNPGTVICIEPNEKLNPFILQSDFKNLILINKAISDRAQTTEFYLHPDSQMSSLFPSVKELIKRDFHEDDYEAIEKKQLEVIALDILLTDYEPVFKNKTIFLKIDTQGNEMDVVKGAAKILKQTKYGLVEFMFQSPYRIKYDFAELISVMKENGFTCSGPMHTAVRTNGTIGAVLFLFSNSKMND